MILVYGRRPYGRIEAHGGEHAHTTFAHFQLLPFVPIGSFWVTEQLGNTVRGFPIALNRKSVLAAYLRMWGFIAAAIVLMIGGLAGGIAAGVLAGLTVWAWTWRTQRGADAHRRSDFQLLAFGTRCDPELMPADMRLDLKARLDAQWRQLESTRTPEDVATFAPQSAGEAVVAFGLLRLAAADGRVEAAEAADRILRGDHDPARAGDGPFRADAQTIAAHVHEQVAAAAGARIAARSQAKPFRVVPALAWLAILGCLGGIMVEGPSLSGVTHLSPAQLAAGESVSGFVDVECSSTEVIGEFEGDHPVRGCAIGDHMLAVVGAQDVDVVGKLIRMGGTDDHYDWPADLRTDDALYGVYIEIESQRKSQVAALICFAVLALTGGGLLVRWRRHLARAAA